MAANRQRPTVRQSETTGGNKPVQLHRATSLPHNSAQKAREDDTLAPVRQVECNIDQLGGRRPTADTERKKFRRRTRGETKFEELQPAQKTLHSRRVGDPEGPQTAKPTSTFLDGHEGLEEEIVSSDLAYPSQNTLRSASAWYRARGLQGWLKSAALRAATCRVTWKARRG